MSRMGSPFTGLWRHPDFVKLWAGQTVSVFGSLITGFALPLVAILALDASALDVALLGMAELAPGLVAGLFAGVWVDRLRRRPIMIAADLGRALLLASVPAAWALGALGLGQLYLVAMLVSVLTVCFDVSYAAYLPSLVARDRLVEGNAKLEASNSVAEVAGFGIAGVLVQLLTAPVAILVDALTFLVSALSLSRIRTAEPGPRPEADGDEPATVVREIADGLRLVWGDRMLRALAGAAATREFFAHIFVAVLTLFLVEELELEPAVFGAVFGIGGISAFVGAIFVERWTRAWGLGRTMLGSLGLSILATFLIPLASGPAPLAAGMLALEQATDGTGMAYQINSVSLRQAITPPRLLGRVNASMRVLEQGAMLLGLLVGGLLGERIGLRPTVFLGVLGMTLALPWIILSPIPALREHPQPATAS